MLRPQATGARHRLSGMPNMPDDPRRRDFQGASTIPASTRRRRTTAGKKRVVIGSNNSAHDICADLWEHGADVTMVQRSSTHVVRSDTLMELALGGLYSERRSRPASPPTAPT